MKKLLLIGVIVFSLFVIIVITTNNTKAPIEYKNEISVEKLQKNIIEKKDSFIYFYQTDCIYCQETSPIVIPMAEEMTIDLKNLNLQEDNAGWETFQIEGTPTIVYYENGQEVDRIVGKQTEESLREWFNNNK